jgi:hypothetical protein
VSSSGSGDAHDEDDVDVVVLAGYMKKLGPETLVRFRGRGLRRRGVGRCLIAAVIEAARGRFGTLRLRTGNPEAARVYAFSRPAGRQTVPTTWSWRFIQTGKRLREPYAWGTRSGRFRTGRVRTDDAPCARSFR